MRVPQINQRARGEIPVCGSPSSAWPLLRQHLLEPRLSETSFIFIRALGLKQGRVTHFHLQKS